MKTLLPEIDSADKRFHNGNPATGEQGTRVTETWLNDVQDRVRDVQAEAHYVLQKAGFTPKAETQTQLYQAIVKIIDDNRKSASTTQKGEVRLTSDTGLDSEELGLTAKAGKKLAQLIATVQSALNNYIPTKNRSSSVNSNDENNVATSKAVKTAYDKGVEAKTAADNAQRTANDGVSKANAAQTSANQAKSAADAAQSSANAANNNANGRISKTDISHATNGTNKAKVASEFAVGELARSFSYQKIGDFEVRKYPDGTMIQTYRFTPPNNRVGAQDKKFTFNWAVAFTEKPKVWIQHNTHESSGYGSLDVVAENVENECTATKETFWVWEWYYNNHLISFDFFAIGRWKR